MNEFDYVSAKFYVNHAVPPLKKKNLENVDQTN